MNRAFEEGWQAFELGKDSTKNPYLKGRHHHGQWREGWESAKEESESTTEGGESED